MFQKTPIATTATNYINTDFVLIICAAKDADTVAMEAVIVTPRTLSVNIMYSTAATAYANLVVSVITPTVHIVKTLAVPPPTIQGAATLATEPVPDVAAAMKTNSINGL